jgi:diguanylate cyclase (GGDEF)-like protein
MTGNGGPLGDKAGSRDISVAVADALVEHDRWLEALRRAMICGLTPDPSAVDETAQTRCGFGQWFERHSQSGILEGDLFVELGRVHHEVHEAARYLAGKAVARDRIPADEYDALISAFDGFRKAAVRVQETHGRPEDIQVAEDDAIAELQSRMTMLSELERESERAARTRAPMCLLMVRPNGLAEIEEKFGNLGIDRLVAGLAARLYSHLRPYDAVYRYGRSEFLICLPGTDTRQASAVTRRLCDTVENAPFALSGSVDTVVSARFGIAMSDTRAAVQEILDRASRAANMAGTDTGERIVVWSAELEN